MQLQILSVLFSLCMIYWSYLSYRRRTIHLIELVFWTCAWGAFALVVILPQTTTVFLQNLQINRVMDLFMILGFMIIWVVLFANHIENRRLRNRLQELVREIALREGEKQ